MACHFVVTGAKQALAPTSSPRLQVSKRSKAAKAPDGASTGAKREKRFAATPAFLAGGQLHGYQVEGVNWLCHAWDRRQHVILADEMGLGAALGACTASHLREHACHMRAC